MSQGVSGFFDHEVLTAWLAQLLSARFKKEDPTVKVFLLIVP